MIPDLDVAAVSRDELPALLGHLVELEARVRLRLAEPASLPAADSRLLTIDEAVTIAGAPSARWLLAHTRGLRFRLDLSRKQPRFEEGGLRRWLLERRT